MRSASAHAVSQACARSVLICGPSVSVRSWHESTHGPCVRRRRQQAGSKLAASSPVHAIRPSRSWLLRSQQRRPESARTLTGVGACRGSGRKADKAKASEVTHTSTGQSAKRPRTVLTVLPFESCGLPSLMLFAEKLRTTQHTHVSVPEADWRVSATTTEWHERTRRHGRFVHRQQSRRWHSREHPEVLSPRY